MMIKSFDFQVPNKRMIKTNKTGANIVIASTSLKELQEKAIKEKAIKNEITFFFNKKNQL